MVAHGAAILAVLSIAVQATTPELGASTTVEDSAATRVVDASNTSRAIQLPNDAVAMGQLPEAFAEAAVLQKVQGQSIDGSRAMAWLLGSCRKMFYLVRPSEVALDETDAVPTFILHNGIPMFLLFIAIEFVITRLVVRVRRYLRKRRLEREREHEREVRLHKSDQGKVDGERGSAPVAPARLKRRVSWANADGGSDRYFFQIKDLLSCIGVGAGQQVFQFMLDVVGMISDFALYSFVYNHFRICTVDVKTYPTFAFVALLLLKDLAYYWQHRLLHEYHVLWASHRVHHSGEDYNLSTGLRQGAFQGILGTPYVIPIALMGFPPQVGAGAVPPDPHRLTRTDS
jgi:hypothetical protein